MIKVVKRSDRKSPLLFNMYAEGALEEMRPKRLRIKSQSTYFRKPHCTYVYTKLLSYSKYI